MDVEETEIHSQSRLGGARFLLAEQVNRENLTTMSVVIASVARPESKMYVHALLD